MLFLTGRVFAFALLTVTALQAGQFQWFTDFNGESSGHTALGFLNLPHSAAELGRGMASSPGGMDATALPGFAANSALADRYRFAFTHLEWLMGIRKEYLGALFPVLDVGTFGFQSQLFTPGDIDNARDIDERPSDPSYIEYSIGASYARGFFANRLSAGCALAFVESRIEEITGRTATGSLDLRYAPFTFLSTHLHATSFGKAIVYSGSTAEPLPARIGLSALVRPLPADHPLARLLDFDVGIGIRKTADEPVIGGISTEIVAGSYFRLRAGYEYVKGCSPSASGLSLGAGIDWRAFRLDGGWRYLSKDFGPVWALSLLYEREELKEHTAEDYYEIALQHYKKQRFTLCTFNAKRALRLDPNMWKAHALISRVKSDILRSKRREIAIVYTGNAQGNFIVPDDDTPGGFARQATVIAALRAQFPLAVIIEAGNMVTPLLQPPRISFVGSYLDYINYDAIGCGSGELQLGMPKVLKATASRQQIICSNALSTPAGVVRHRIIERDGYRFFIAAYINPATVPEGVKPLLRPFMGDELRQAANNCDLRILIAHDSWERIRAQAAELIGFDIVICGNLDQRFPSPMKAGPLTVLSAGSRGKYVGNLTVRFDENRKITGMENRLIPLQSEIVPDSAVAHKIALFSTTAQAAPAPAGVPRATQGTFAFISDRSGKNEVYLKVTGQMAEFPLTRTIADTCDNPVFSFAAGKIACRALANGCRRLMTMRFDGNEKRYVADSLQVNGAAFTPDGAWLYYAAAPCGDTMTDLYRVKSGGGPSFAVVSWPEGAETAPAFSADGSMMAFCSDRDGSMQLYLTNPEGELPLRITDDAANHTSPAFSPDGAAIAYLSDAANFGGRRDLWLFERSGGTHRRITQRSNVKEFCWLSDSRTIVYTMGAMTDELATVNVTDYRFSNLIPDDTARAWQERSPQTMQFEGKEHIIYVRYYPGENDRQIYRVRTDGTGNTRIVNSPGRDWLGGEGNEEMRK